MIASHLLHGVAWVAVHTRPLSEAFRVTRSVAAFLPTLDADASAEVARRLRGGTCLTRSLTVAARTPGASVAIGGTRTNGAFRAHAWVELEGEPLSGQTTAAGVLVRILPQ